LFSAHVLIVIGALLIFLNDGDDDAYEN